MITEIITWIPIAESFPDSDLTVLGFNKDWDEPIWPCYLDGEEWFSAEGDLLSWEGADNIEPTHWAQFPKGPYA
ncbi:hypothetical protein BH09VER1_BH09VER1_28690 [soil metagenome]